MQAGHLRQRVTLQNKSVTRDAYGDEIVNWTDAATVWASVEPLRGREFYEARQEHADVTTRIRLRFRRSIDTHMRVSWTDEVGGVHLFDIEGVQHIHERKRETHLMCTETVTP